MMRGGWITVAVGLVVLGFGVGSFLYSLWFQPHGGANIGSPIIGGFGLIICVVGVVILLVGHQNRRLGLAPYAPTKRDHRDRTTKPGSE